MTNLAPLIPLYLAARAGFRAPSTLAHYERALGLFVQFCPVLPTDEIEQINLLVRFVQHLITEATPDKLCLSHSTSNLYAIDVKLWLKWLAVNSHLPASFPLQKCIAELNEALRGSSNFKRQAEAPEPPPGIEKLLTYHAMLPPPDDLPDAKLAAWELERLRDAALIHCLYDSGARVSEVLQFSPADLPALALETVSHGGYWRVRVVGKKQHMYDAWLREAVFYVDEYIEVRGVGEKHAGPLFVRHSGTYGGKSLTGQPLSRQAARYIISSAARALGLGNITPHDFRHWKATRLRSAGVSVEDIAHVLGHADIQTTKDYYAHVDVGDLENRLRGVE